MQITTTGNSASADVNTTSAGAVAVTSGTSSVVLQATSSTGQPLSAGASGSLVVEDGQFLQASGRNMLPNSQVALWGFSEPRLIGVVFTDANGAYRASLPVPPGMPIGDHTLQTNGTAKSGSRLSIALGMVVLGADKGAVTRAKATSSVHFAPMSSTLDARAKVTLQRLVRSVKGAPTRSVVIGYVQDSASTRNNLSLSRARAVSVATYLRQMGLAGRIATQGKGVANASGERARRVDVVIVYAR